MRHLSRYLLLVLCSAYLPVWAQQANLQQSFPPPQTTSGLAPAPLHLPAAKDSGLVHLNIVATNKSGKPVTGLDRSDFTLFEDKHPVPLADFHAWGSSASAPPTQIVLAIDTVNATYLAVQFERQAIEKFLRENNGHLAHPVWIVWLTDTGINVQSPPSTDGMTLATQLDNTPGIRRVINRTAQWDHRERFQMSLVQLNQIITAEAGQPGRKLVIWVGPQWPLFPRLIRDLTTRTQGRIFNEIVNLTTELRQEQITLYDVSQGLGNPVLYRVYLAPVKKPSDADLDPLTLEVLAIHSGGLVFEPSNDIQHNLDAVAAEASPYYTLAFQPPSPDQHDAYHALAVRVDEKGLTARTVTGYYNDPSESGR